MTVVDRIAARRPDATRRLVTKMLDVADRIHALLEQKGMSQKDLAVALGASESTISKWVSGIHNLELRTIVRIEEALGEDVLTVPKPQAVAKKTRCYVFVPLHSNEINSSQE